MFNPRMFCPKMFNPNSVCSRNWKRQTKCRAPQLSLNQRQVSAAQHRTSARDGKP